MKTSIYSSDRKIAKLSTGLLEVDKLSRLFDLALCPKIKIADKVVSRGVFERLWRASRVESNWVIDIFYLVFGKDHWTVLQMLMVVINVFSIVFLPISLSRFQQRLSHWSLFGSLNFWEIFGHLILGKRYFFSWKDSLNWGKYVMLKIWRIWKIEIWIEELVDGHHTVPYQPGSVFNPF